MKKLLLSIGSVVAVAAPVVAVVSCGDEDLVMVVDGQESTNMTKQSVMDFLDKHQHDDFTIKYINQFGDEHMYERNEHDVDELISNISLFLTSNEESELRAALLNK